MAQTRIAVVIGSLRHDSLNRKLALAITHLTPPDFSFEPVRIDDLPLYNQDDDGNQAASVKRLKSEISAADGVVFVTPELAESTYSLRADVLSDLLQRCTSVKTVRLCLQFGRELALPWVTKLDATQLPTGSGRAWVFAHHDSLCECHAVRSMAFILRFDTPWPRIRAGACPTSAAAPGGLCLRNR